jgi:hypothetical protein
MAKLNSHLSGLLIVGGLVAAYFLFFKDKTMETFMGYNIIKKGGKYVGEKVVGDRETNPTFDTVDQCKAWITATLASQAAGAKDLIADPNAIAQATALFKQVTQ